jgi:hypothetical protein
MIFSRKNRTVEDVTKQATSAIQSTMTDLFTVTYDPAFPSTPTSKLSIFQVVFAVGPGEDTLMRELVHNRFQQLLTILAPFPEAQTSRFALRARRHVPSRSPPHHPYMFIEAWWHGEDVSTMLNQNCFDSWHSLCAAYINRFDKNDSLNKPQHA